MPGVFGTTEIKRGEAVIKSKSDSCLGTETVWDSACIEGPDIGPAEIPCESDTCCEAGYCKKKGRIELTLDQPSPVEPCHADADNNEFVASGLEPSTAVAIAGTARLMGNISPPPASCKVTVTISSRVDKEVLKSEICTGQNAASCSASYTVQPTEQDRVREGFYITAEASGCCLEENKDDLSGVFLQVYPPEFSSLEGHTDVNPFPEAGAKICRELDTILDDHHLSAMPSDWEQSRIDTIRYSPRYCDLGRPTVEVEVKPKNSVDYWSYVAGSSPYDYIAEVHIGDGSVLDTDYIKLKQIWWYGSDENSTECGGNAEYNIKLSLSFGSISATTDQGFANIGELPGKGVFSHAFHWDQSKVRWETQPSPVSDNTDEATCEAIAYLSADALYLDMALMACGPGPYGGTIRNHEFYHYKQWTGQVPPNSGGVNYDQLLSELNNTVLTQIETVSRRDGEGDQALSKRACSSAINIVMGKLNDVFDKIDFADDRSWCLQEYNAFKASCSDSQGLNTWKCARKSYGCADLGE